MKKLLARVFLLLAALIGFLNVPSAVSAQPLADQTIYSLTDLGAPGDIVMRGPYETASVRFDLPPTWALQQGANLLLNVSTYMDTAGVAAPQDLATGASGALLNVYFNGALQQSAALTLGENIVYNVPISSTAFSSPYADGRYQITFSLDAAFDCRVNTHTTVKIGANSQALLPHAPRTLQLDLHRLPWPMYQPRARVPALVALVVADAPSASEMNAALLVMAAFGRMTDRKLPVTLMTTHDATEAITKASDLVFVGKGSDLPLLSGVALPVPVKAGAFASPDMQADDGVLQMAVSPWNAEKSILVVGGNTDAGLLKAAQALTTNHVQTASESTYSVVAQVNPVETKGLLNANPSNPQSSDYALSDLGYSAITSTGVGTSYFTYEFVISPGQVPSAGPYLNINYSYSRLVDPNLSSADIYLNEQRVGSISLAADNPNSATAHVPLPPSLLKSGRNIVELTAGLLPKDSCAAFSFNDLWVTIFADSILHLPLTPAEPSAFVLQDLKAYPSPFNSEPSLSTSAFVLPAKDPKAWPAAGQIAYDLGGQATGSVLAFQTVYDGAIPDALRSRNLIVVGLPAGLNTLADFKDALPAYFDRGSNIANLQSQEVVYRVSANKDLGYLELFASPWNDQSAVLTVLGTTAKGVSGAGNALTDVNTRDGLAGNFATVDGKETIVADTRTGLGIGHFSAQGSTSSPTAAVVQSPQNSQVALQAAAAQKRMVLGGLIAIVVLMVLIAALYLAIRRRNAPHN